MKMKILVICAFVLCLSWSVLAQMPDKTRDKMSKKMTPEQTLVNMEKTLWQNLVDKKYDDFQKAIAEDYQGVYDREITTKASEIAEIKQMTFKSADVSDVKVKFLDKDAAIITSTVKANVVTPDGMEMNANYRTTSVAVKRGGNWMVVYHSDVTIK